MRHLGLKAAAATLAAGLAVVTAGAAPAFAGTTKTVTQTTHFSSIHEYDTAINPQTNNGCPSWAVNDVVHIDMNGNGIQHTTQNGNDDFWFTTTFTGTGTITFYTGAPIFDNDGNVTGVTGSPEKQVAGHLTQWFGFEANAQNSVQHGTVTFVGTVVGGSAITLHFHNQAVWTPGMDPNGPPKFAIADVSCS
jgi:hypothetical protein